MNIIITGGSGYLGRALTDSLLTNDICQSFANTEESMNVYWVSRNKDIQRPEGIQVLTYDEFVQSDTVYDVLINLAGAGVADARWSMKRKQHLYDSRLQPTQAILDYLEKNKAHQQVSNRPQLFMSGSAIGWYGTQHLEDTTALTEQSTCVTDDFAHQLCDKWEKLAMTATNNVDNVTVALLRTGLVLSSDTSAGGMVSRLKLPFSLGLGGQLASGQQMMSWISRRDWIRAVEFIISNHVNNYSNNDADKQVNAHSNDVSVSSTVAHTQIYNLTAPTPVSNKEFTKAVGSWLKRPTVFSQPTFVLKTLLGEMATLLIDGQVVVPQQLLDEGFDFMDKDILDALI